jgi:SOS-response transcriptional repressor LexA
MVQINDDFYECLTPATTIQVLDSFTAGKPIPMTQHTSAHLKLASALKLRIRLGEYALELEDSLSRLAEEQVEVLERQLKRARY